jgi:hypothetical protein
MNTLSFNSQLLPDGHLYCPEQFTHKKDIKFKVLVMFENTQSQASAKEIEQAAVIDNSEEFLSQEEINYYMKLEDI